MRAEGRLKLIKSAMPQHSQLGWAMTMIKGFPQAPPELRAGQSAGENAELETMEKRGWQALGKKIITRRSECAVD